MPDITDSVGEPGAANKVHDVALVQAMLRVVKNAKSSPYLAGEYDGVYGGHTKTAIVDFQTDQKLIVKDGTEKLGVVSKGGPTLAKLSALVPAQYQTLRIMENTKTVYLESSAADTATSKAAVVTATLEPGFQTKVGQLVQLMFDQHKITLWLAKDGARRTFAEQAAQTKTFAGPGESNHNFGRAVDIGFKNFNWVQGNGTIKQDADWLNALEAVSAAKANAFWDARDAIALKTVGLFRLQFERVHLQAFDDSTVSTPRSLAKLLNTVGKMKWEPQYKCDLGYGGALFFVGTAKQIWAGNAVVTKTMIAQAMSAKLKKVVKDAEIKAQQLNDMKKALKADFELADQGWLKWVAVP